MKKQQTPILLHHLLTRSLHHQPTVSSISSPEVNLLYTHLTSSTLLSLSTLPIPLTPSLLHAVLLRLRFSHASPHLALRLFNLHPSPSSPSLHTLLFILSRSRLFHLCYPLLSRHPSLVSPKSLQIVLARIAKVCSLHECMDSFWRMKTYVAEFDTRCFNALLRALAQEKSMAAAKIAYHRLKKNFRPDLETFTVLLSGWKKAEDAEAFFEEMRGLGVKPDLVCYNCLVDVFCKGREMRKAYGVVEEMKGREIFPDVYTYTSLIGGLGLIGQPDKARGVLKEMREFGVCPDVAAYNAVIRNFCIAKRIGNAVEVMEEMKRAGLDPNPTSFNLFFRVFYWANDLRSSWGLYRRMRTVEGCLPNTQSCMFLVRLCKRHDDVEKVMELWDDMVGNGFGALGLVSDVLFDLLCDMGKLEEAERCFVQMVEKGQKPSNVSFRRIKVLMELASRHESLRRLLEMMESFGNSSRVVRKTDEEKMLADVPSYEELDRA